MVWGYLQLMGRIEEPMTQGIKRIVMPERNKPDLEEVPQEIRDTLEFITVSKMDEVLAAALESPVAAPTPTEAVVSSN